MEHGAALFNRPDMARWLLDNGAFAGLTDRNGKTAAQVARDRGHAAVLAVLEEYARDL
jgi:ankyrin repeat protein